MIKYLPNEFLKKVAPESKVKKLIRDNMTLNKAVLSFLDGADFISKATVQRTALNSINQYKERFDRLKDEGASASEAKSEAVNDKAMLVNRVQNTVITEVASEIKDQYRGEYYIWLPSDAEEPDPLHQLKYGKKFQLGKGEMPGERYGCRCGMQILVDEDKLEL